MLTLDCLVAGCKERVANADEDIAVALFNAHISTHTADTGHNRGSGLSKNEEGIIPKITQEKLLDPWNPFQVLRNRYKTDTELAETEGGLQATTCCDEVIGTQLRHADPNATAKPETERLKSIRQ